MGDCCNSGWFFCFDGGDRCGNWSRGNLPAFLVLNRFSEADPALGQGVPCLTGALGMSFSGGRLEFCGTSAKCPIANLYTVTGIESAVDATIGMGADSGYNGGRCG